MTERKPPEKPRRSWVEEQIRDAQKRGEFDGLPGHGKPLENLEEVSDPLWWTKSLLRRERLSILPPALELRRKVEASLERISRMDTEADVRAAVAELNARIARVNATAAEGPGTDIAPLDAERVVAEWARRRPAGGTEGERDD